MITTRLLVLKVNESATDPAKAVRFIAGEVKAKIVSEAKVTGAAFAVEPNKTIKPREIMEIIIFLFFIK